MNNATSLNYLGIDILQYLPKEVINCFCRSLGNVLPNLSALPRITSHSPCICDTISRPLSMERFCVLSKWFSSDCVSVNNTTSKLHLRTQQISIF